MSTAHQKRFQTRTFTPEQVIDALESAGFPCQQAGREVNADITNSGHFHLKIAPAKGVWLDASDGSKTGTISQLFRQLGTRAPDVSKAMGTTSFRPAESGNNEETTEKSKTQIDAINLWKHGSWTAADSEALPDAWDKDLSSAQKGFARQKFEDQRKTVRNYIKTRLSADHLDHWMKQVRITTAQGLMVVPMRKNGEITGIQRTFFDSFGQKTERKMLGKQGVCVLPPPAGVLPRNLGTGSSKNRLIGEGFETVAATVQAAGYTGISCFFDGGIVKYSREQSKLAKTLTPEQIETAAASIFLVDRDQSKAGQIACAKAVKILRMAGLKAFFAMPPAADQGGPKGGEKGSDWGDYPKEDISSEILAAHLALAIAHGDRDMPEIQEKDINPDFGENVSDYVNIDKKSKNGGLWRESEHPEQPVETSPVSEVRSFLQTELQKIVEDYKKWFNDDSQPFLPVLFMPTMGTGKTTSANALYKNPEIEEIGGRLVVFTASHLEAKDYESTGFFHFYGRNEDSNHAGYCPAHETAKTAMEQNHISQAEVCRRCKHGYKWAINYYSEMDAEKYKERIVESKKKIEEMGLDWETVVACRWQTHLRDALDAAYVVAASGSYSHSLTKDALVVFDEHFETGKGIKVRLEDIDGWATRNQQILDFLEKNDGEPEKIARHKKAAEFFQKIALSMAAWVGKTGAISVDKELTESIVEILKIAKETRKTAKDIDLADWETLQFNRAGELTNAPLRGAHAIAESLKFGDGFVEKGALVIAQSLPIMERLASGLPTIVMDATPDPVIVDVVTAAGGKIVNAIAKQNVKIKRYVARFWGLSELNSKNYGQDRVDDAVDKYKKLIHHHYKGDGENGFLMHALAYANVGFRDIEEDAEGDAIGYKGDLAYVDLGAAGYWGRDHRAHNRWAGRELVIIGGFYPPTGAVRAMYQVSRIAALSAGANPDAWPVWADDMEMIKNEYVCEGKADVVCRYPLPADPHIRKWLLARITAETVQAIGRVRGANCKEPVIIHIYGGVPLAGLGAHGLTVDSYENDPECIGVTKSNHDDAMKKLHDGKLAECDAIGARVIASGKTITRDTLREEVDAINAARDKAHGMTDGKTMDQSGDLYSSPPRIYIHTEGGRIENERVVLPKNDTIQEWIAQRMPVIAAHMSTKGKSGKLVKEAQKIAQEYGEKALADAIDFAENLVNTGGNSEDAVNSALETIEEKPYKTDIEINAGKLLDSECDNAEESETGLSQEIPSVLSENSEMANTGDLS